MRINFKGLTVLCQTVLLAMKGQTAPIPELEQHGLCECVYTVCVGACVCVREEIVLYLFILGNSRPFSVAGRDYGQL